MTFSPVSVTRLFQVYHFAFSNATRVCVRVRECVCTYTEATDDAKMTARRTVMIEGWFTKRRMQRVVSCWFRRATYLAQKNRLQTSMNSRVVRWRRRWTWHRANVMVWGETGRRGRCL